MSTFHHDEAIYIPEPHGVDVDEARRRLASTGFVVLQSCLLGVPPELGKAAHNELFPQTRRDAVYAPHEDRDRARDVLEYVRRPGSIALRYHGDHAIYGRNDQRTRIYERAFALGCEPLVRWVAACLAVVPVADQDERGTFGVNLFRTRTVVTQGRHRDAEAYVCIEVADRNCHGAVTRLFRDRVGNELAGAVELVPGQLLVFRDELFWHDCTPIVPRDGEPYREALVCTINYPTTYRL